MSTADPRGAGDGRPPMSPPPERAGTRPEYFAVLPAEEHGPTLSWWGTILAVISVGMFLSAILFAYAFLSLRDGGWPPDGVERPDLLVPSVATVVLLASGLPAYLAQRAAKARNGLLLQVTAVGAALLGTAHIVLQVSTYTDLPMQPDEHAYGSVFILLLVLHHLLLASGVVGFVMAAVQVWGRPGERLIGTTKGLVLWWFGLLGFWVLVFATLYVSPLALGGG